MKRYYDKEHERLIYIGSSASEQFWDDHWQTNDFRKAITSMPNSWVAKTTKKYLRTGSKVLEGGCGQANHVYALHTHGFDAIGLDYAPETVKKLKKYSPELRIEHGDVRKLPFEENYFDGYWSVGVIEHFWSGFNDIASEMARVIRGGGYLFLTFPVMSSLRKWIAKHKNYQKWEGKETEPDGFYQFALDSQSTIQHFTSLGFEVIHSRGFDGVKGIKDEISLIKPLFQKIYDSQNISAKISRKIIDLSFSHYCGHSKLFVLQNK